MKLLEKILIATDLGPTSDELVQNGIKLAKIINGRIILLYVLNLSSENKGIQQFLLNATKIHLTKIKDQIIKEGVECDEPIIASGSVYDEIVNEASINDVNLIFIGSGNKNTNSHYALGLNAKKVIQKTQIPVWVNKSGSKIKIDKILCPVDFSDSSIRAIKSAIVLSKKFHAKLYVQNVYESVHTSGYLDKDYLEKELEKEKRINEDFFNDFISDFDFRGLDWEKSLNSGFPEIEILNFIKMNDIDLLIMGSAGKSGLSKLFLGSVTEKVIRELPCSFITTKSKDLIRVVIESKINDTDTHFREAELLYKEGFYGKAIQEYNLCLDIDPMHIRSLQGLAMSYGKLNDKVKSKYYKNLAEEVYKHMWDDKIEKEVRKNYEVKGGFHLQH